MVSNSYYENNAENDLKNIFRLIDTAYIEDDPEGMYDKDVFIDQLLNSKEMNNLISTLYKYYKSGYTWYWQ